VTRDGVDIGTTPAEFPAPYFGEVRIALEKPISDTADTPLYEPAGGLVEVPAPELGLIFPFEIFPLDFVTEAIARVGGLAPTTAKFELPERPRPSDDELTDDELERIIERYQAAAVQR